MEQTNTKDSDTLTVDGVKYVQTGPERYRSDEMKRKYEYRFGEVHVEDVIEMLSPPKGAELEGVGEGKDAVKYQFKDMPPVIVTPNAVYGRERDSRIERGEQAYFALSLMASAGCVTGWGRK